MARSPVTRQRLAGVLALAFGSALMVVALTSTDRGSERELATGGTETSTHPTVLGTTIERATPEAQPATPATFHSTATTASAGAVTSTTARRSSAGTNGGSGSGPLVPAPTLGPPTVVTNTTTSTPATTEPLTTTTEPPTTTTEPPTTTTEPPTTTTEPPPP